ncbi:uncharacterized protein At4g10930 isoform X3 [Vitis vinifera]|uniref:uncharacterized protein At4g10930 isoform X3 n=1 Tax=Vitis vinifera TaxID=29760 RepID=UPI00053FD287|nr:uncharacterized protein At4g10930 isoform X3 [Vitis vinifera]XP_059598524.1 uncharacterized protein At4g10930 isoform X3 [Vitis vinifera]|eukprot:XP_010659436.1 PREDICTED: uncharacterized protein At4g10930 isoform X3 [Vitis vinifera]
MGWSMFFQKIWGYFLFPKAVICLDGDGCKIRSGSATITEDSNLDTSIACDSCDIWYHAFCVGFDPEGTSEDSWLCPRCAVAGMPGKSVVSGLGDGNSECLLEDGFSRKLSVSVADAGETALVVSMVEGNQWMEESSEDFLSNLEDCNDWKFESYLISDANCLESPTPSAERDNMQPNLEAQELELSLSRDTSFSLPSNSSVLNDLKTNSANKIVNEPSGFDGLRISSTKLLDGSCSENKPSESESSIGLHLGLSVGSFLSVESTKDRGTDDENTKDTGTDEVVAADVHQQHPSEESPLSADKIIAHANEDMKIAGVKRKHTDYSDGVQTSAGNGKVKAEIGTEVSAKKVRAEGKIQMAPIEKQANGQHVSVDAQKGHSTVEVSTGDELRHNRKRKEVTSDIMSIVQGTDRRPLKGLAEKSDGERENATGLRVKKIMKRASEDKESAVLVQKLRKEIREAVRSKSSIELGTNLFDPKLLTAFRAAIAGPITETTARKLSPSALKVKKSMLQKGKIRENLTKKIYATSKGKRRRAWDRDLEVEFWKHRCMRATKPEKIETLKSVLDLLRTSECIDPEQGSESQTTNPILSRLYLADTSVFPRKDDIKPLAALKASGNPEQNKEHASMEKVSKPALHSPAVKAPETCKIPSKVGFSPYDHKGNKSNASSLKDATAHGKPHPGKRPEGSSIPLSVASKVNSQKEAGVKSDDIKTDKRKWALEVLARKNAAASKNTTQEKQEDNALLKGNYPLLTQLPRDMRPVLAPSQHNKIPASVRQTQLYRLTEHFLRKANLPVIRRTAETELAVADAVNIEREVANRSNSKLVYVNLCSQELLHRSDGSKSSRALESDSDCSKSSRAIESDPLPPAESTDRSEPTTNELSTDPEIEEALRTAGLLSDSPPNSPLQEIKDLNDEDDPSKDNREEGPDNVFEMDSHLELDIYGDFEYDLEDEEYIGATALKASKVQEEGESKMKVVFSTLNSDRSNDVLNLEEHVKVGIAEAPKNSPSSLKHHTDTCIRSSTMEGGTDHSCLPPESFLGEGGKEPSLEECEELYGPDKEPLIQRFPEKATELYGLFHTEALAKNTVPGKNENYGEDQAVKGGENSPNPSQTGENGRKEKSNTDTNKQTDSSSSVHGKVEAYIKEHIRPLCKSGVITVEQYRWAVGKTTEKVMKYHAKAKNANFLIKEGEKVKKLAEQYVEAAQK